MKINGTELQPGDILVVKVSGNLKMHKHDEMKTPMTFTYGAQFMVVQIGKELLLLHRRTGGIYSPPFCPLDVCFEIKREYFTTEELVKSLTHMPAFGTPSEAYSTGMINYLKSRSNVSLSKGELIELAMNEAEIHCQQAQEEFSRKDKIDRLHSAHRFIVLALRMMEGESDDD